ncbi:type II secretion system protein [Pandoraea pneumonica]|uniref:type II secretion system protein n=1 Tax=Pandoraea pneumonica TaxID=2508299 RepID=UPI003CF32861
MTMQVNAGALAQFKTNMTKRLNKRRQRGVTLVELAVAVAVMGMIMAGALVGVPALMTSLKTTRTVTELQQIVAKAHGAFGTGILTGDGAGRATTDPGFNSLFEELPPSGTAGEYRNQFGGVTRGVNVVVNSAVKTGAVFEYTNIPAKACEKIIPQVAANFTTILANGVPVKDYGGALGDATAIANACGTEAAADPADPRVNTTVTAIRFGISQ